MRIAHVIWSLWTGGSESMLIDIANEQSKKHTVALVVVNAAVNPRLATKVSDRIKLIPINRAPGSKRILDVIRLNVQLRLFQPDIVHCHNWNLVRLLKLGRFATVLTVHNAHVDLEEAWLCKYDAIFAISEAVQHHIITQSAKSTPLVVYNGIDFQAVRQRAEYQYDVFDMVQIGELNCRLKGQDVLLRALHWIVYEHGTTRVHLNVIGDGESRGYLEGMRQELNLTPYCAILGWQDRDVIYTNLAKYHLLIQPSRSEGFGLTIVEGMAAKIPVLVSSIEGPMEIIQSGKYGYYFGVGDAQDCAEKIVKVMSEYASGEARRKAEEAYTYALARFDIRRTAADYTRGYQECIA